MLKKIYDLALPRLEERQIEEVRIGIEMLGVELDDKSLGVSYVLDNEAEECCMAMSEAGELDDMAAEDMAAWFIESDDLLKRALGLATINAVIDFDSLTDVEMKDAGLAAGVREEDIVGMIGYIKPVAKMVQGKCKDLIVFDRSAEEESKVKKEVDYDKLSKCDLLFITGTALINRTLEEILEYSQQIREVVLLGPTTPLYPEAFVATPVSKLAGMKWNSDNRKKVLKIISQAGGMRQFSHLGDKITIGV